MIFVNNGENMCSFKIEHSLRAGYQLLDTHFKIEND